jgi:hypothetical protein
MQKYKLFGLAPPIWVAQNLYALDVQHIINLKSKSCQSQEKTKPENISKLAVHSAILLPK